MTLTARHDPDEPPLLTANEVVQLLRVSERTLDRLIADGHLTALVLPSGHRRFRRSDVLALLSERSA